MTVLPAVTVTLRDLPSALMLTVMSALVTCGERQLTSKKIASKAEKRPRLRRIEGLVLSLRTEWRRCVAGEIQEKGCIVFSALFWRCITLRARCQRQ